MIGPLLRTGKLSAFRPLGTEGSPVFSAATQLRASITRRLGHEAADLLAIPQINESGDTVDWYAPRPGDVVPWHSATDDERRFVKEAIEGLRAQLTRHSAELLAQPEIARSGSAEAAVIFARLLPLVGRAPDDTHVYLVGGEPVVTFWGFEPLDAPPGWDALGHLQVSRAGSASPAASAEAPVSGAGDAQRPGGWRSWGWLWTLLLALPLLGGLLWLLLGARGCEDTAARLKSFFVSPSEPGAAVPSPASPADVREGGGAPLTLPPGGAGASGTAAAGDRGGADPAAPGGEPTGEPGSPPPAPPPPSPDAPRPDQPPGPTPPPDPLPAPDPAVPPVPPPAPKPTDQAGDGARPPPEGLAIPGDAARSGRTDFLNGRWRSRSSLMDSRTGRPLDVEYAFEGGKGTSTIRRSDGTHCAAPATAAMHQGVLVIEQTQDARCPDGKVFDRSRVECRPGKDGGKAECRGVHAEGGGYRVEIGR